MADLVQAPEQPYGVELKMADDVFIKQMAIPKAGTIIPQHSHTYDHTSMLALGSIRVWEDDALIGDFKAPTGLTIRAGTKHKFMSLEDDTIVYCIHNIARTGAVDIDEEHQLF